MGTIRNPVTLLSNFITSVWDAENDIVKTGAGGGDSTAATNIGAIAPTNEALADLSPGGATGFGAGAFLEDPLANAADTASVGYEINTLIRWMIRAYQEGTQELYRGLNHTPEHYYSGGANWTSAGDASGYFSVSSGEIWTVTAAEVTVVTSATVATRRVQYYATNSDGSQVLDRSVLEITQAASLTYRYEFGIGKSRSSAPVSGSNIIDMPISPVTWKSGDRLYFTTGAAQSGDTIAVNLTVNRRREGNFI